MSGERSGAAVAEWISAAQEQVNVQSNDALIRRLLDRLTYREGWSFSIVAHGGWHRALQIQVNATDPHLSRNGRTVQVLVNHQFQVPYFVMTQDEMLRWLLDCVLAVERHETCEWLQVDGVAPFMPEHGEGSDPYKIPVLSARSSNDDGCDP